MPNVISEHELNDCVDQVSALLNDGKLLAIPTETVYGLAGDATDGIAVAKIFEMKGRPQFNPLICHVHGLEMAEEIGRFSLPARKLAEACWPGPLTLVLPIKHEYGIHPLVTANLGTVGLRHPKGVAGEIIKHFGKPLAAPSANRSGRISPTTAEHVLREFFTEELTVVDAGRCEIGLESTIVKVESNELTILRPGFVTSEMIETATGIHPSGIEPNPTIEAPGMMASHYAPNASLLIDRVCCPAGAGLLSFGDGTGKNREGAAECMNLSESADLTEAAANLYTSMNKLDSAGHETIAVEPIPRKGLGLAINDRLSRAAAPKTDEKT